MARVTIEDCIRHYPNRFEMVLLASKRARQILQGSDVQGDFPLDDKFTVLSLREIAAGSATWETLEAFEEMERQRALEAEQS